MAMTTLNVGSHGNTFGDVRLDIDARHRPTVIADAHYLPFRDDTFLHVQMCHVLEHLNNPKQALDEAKRVGFTINARFPYKYNRIPWILSVILTFNIPYFLMIIAANNYFRGPMRHLWSCQPFGTWKINRTPLPQFIGLSTWRINKCMEVDGKTIPYRWLWRFTPWISAEYECVWSKSLT